METAVVNRLTHTTCRIIAGLIVDVHFFSLSIAGEDMLIAYTVSDGTYLIFGGEEYMCIAGIEIIFCTYCLLQMAARA